jgi:hypothetical protein
MTKLPTRLATAVVVTATVGASVVPVGTARALGHDGDRVERRGFCTNGARWDIRAESDDGRIEVDAEIDTSRAGRRWDWVLKHNGSVSARGTSRTRPPSGSFEVERYSIDLSGTDTFRFRASRKGARCVATISW